MSNRSDRLKNLSKLPVSMMLLNSLFSLVESMADRPNEEENIFSDLGIVELRVAFRTLSHLGYATVIEKEEEDHIYSLDYATFFADIGGIA
jgi:hypothetical protein